MDQPNSLFRWVVFLFGGGDAAILSAVVMTGVAFAGLRPGRKKPLSPMTFASTVTICLVVSLCSSPSIPGWLIGATAIWLLWVLKELVRRSTKVTSNMTSQIASTSSMGDQLLTISPFVWLLFVFVWQFPYLFWWPSSEPISTLMVIGDSVTAGLNDNEDTWPNRLSRECSVNVLDASQPGATLQSALAQNSLFGGNTGAVILEIGGNDLLEGKPVKRFEQDLDRLLTEVCHPGRSVIMFELPLPPLSASYGTIQRCQAARHRVKLIPKRYFATVLSTRGATVDGIHLSQKGQSQMAEMIRSLLGPQLNRGTGTYEQIE